MKKILPLLTPLFFCLNGLAQQAEKDSLVTLDAVTVRAFEQYRTPNKTTAPVRIIQFNNSDRNNKLSLVNSFNSIAGVRMEERSPGSYRINIRGSSLRSPFGVRNIKTYWNDIPITDAGGNTYFNQFAWNNFSSIELFKGPASSLYGAGTGGLILMNNFDNWRPGASLEYVGGSYGLHNILASARFGDTEHANQVTYAHNQSDGYRVQTRMRRDNVSWSSRIKSSEKQELTASLLYTDLYYQTPGALNLNEYNSNPKAARPAGGGFPSAVDAHAAISQKNLTAGFSNRYQISQHWRNQTTLFGSFSQIKNSAIRNYERRSEPQWGGRTLFVLDQKQQKNGWQWIAGAEFQQGYFNTQVANNRNGNPDTIQTNDDIRNTLFTAFTQADINLGEKWLITAGLSLNRAQVAIRRLSEYPVTLQKRSYRNELTPRLAILRELSTDLYLLASVSKGFSPPTTAEVLPSTGVISTDLEAEQGWNYELTARYSLFNRKLQLEATGFYFKLNNALVQRRDLSGGDYFINAGDVRQKGVELHADYTYNPASSHAIRYVLIQTDYTYNHFRYGSFIKGTDDFSGKKVPSVPASTLSVLADVQSSYGWYSQITWYMASRIYLNDANTAAAKAYQLLGWRLGWRKNLSNGIRLNLYAGADNLLDEKYSLGNDINAAGGRYYNAAPRRNFYGGVAVQWDKKK
jgi:iron complex outermembrane receptor protein